MQKIDFNSGAPVTRKITLSNIEDVRQYLTSKTFHWEIDRILVTSNTAVVRVNENSGTTMFYAQGALQLAELGRLAHRQEKKGFSTLYYIKMDGQEVELE